MKIVRSSLLNTVMSVYAARKHETLHTIGNHRWFTEKRNFFPENFPDLRPGRIA